MTAQQSEHVMPERAHGTDGGYKNWRCRCDRCRSAHAQYERDGNRARQRAMWQLVARHREEFRALVSEQERSA